MALRAQLFRGDPKLEAAAVSNPAHIVPGAVGPHVGKIQQALIELDGAVIAADELVASSYGSSTAAAVLAYKQKRDIVNRSYQTTADNIVGIMTMASLDTEMARNDDNTVPVLGQSQNGTCVEMSKPAAGPGPFAPSPDIVFAVTHLLPQVRIAIRAAEFRLLAANPFVTNRRQTLPTGPGTEAAQASLKLMDKVFGFFTFDNPRPVFENMRTLYRNMTVALNRSFETAPLIAPTLFVPNPQAGMEKVASAYTSAGGAFIGPKVKMSNGLPANRIYLCNNLAPTSTRFRTQTAIHELAHYVSGQPIRIDDPLHGFFFDPADGANLAAADPTVSAKAKRLPPVQKIRDAAHYAAFAFLAAGGRLF